LNTARCVFSENQSPQHERDAEREALQVRAEVHAVLADGREPAAVDQLEERR
jgi:hypothetical protein